MLHPFAMSMRYTARLAGFHADGFSAAPSISRLSTSPQLTIRVPNSKFERCYRRSPSLIKCTGELTVKAPRSCGCSMRYEDARFFASFVDGRSRPCRDRARPLTLAVFETKSPT